MEDEVNRGLERASDAIAANKPVIELRPIFYAIGQPLVVDDDQQIIVRLISLSRARLVDPAAARIAPKEDDLEYAPRLLPGMVRERKGMLEFLESNRRTRSSSRCLSAGRC